MKKMGIFLVTLIMTVLSTGIVHAKTTVDVNWSSKNEQVKAGEEVLVTLRFQNHTDVTKGFNAFMATLVYDENYFEKVTEENFIFLNDWEELKYNPVTKEFVAIKKAGSTSAENVVQISLKVKDGAKAGIVNVGVANLVTSEGKEDIYLTSKQDGNYVHEIKLNIIDDGTIPSNNDNNNNNDDKPNSDSNNNGNVVNHDNNNGNKNQTSNYKKVNVNEKETSTTVNTTDYNTSNEVKGSDNKRINEDKKNYDNQKDTSIKAGVAKDYTIKKKEKEFPINSIFVLIILIMLIIAILTIYLKYFRRKDEKEKKNRMFIFFLAVLIASIQSINVVFASSLELSKGDINQDGKINYDDIRLLEYHLIHISGKELKGNSYNYADMNNDGQLTVTDLTLVVQKIEKTLDYGVVISNVKVDNYYPKKNEEVIIKFSALTKYNERVSSVMINGKEYKAERIGQLASLYQVKVPVGNTAGLKTFNITSVTLYNGRTQKINEEIMVDVQKDKPSIENYLVKEDKNRKVAIVSFDVVDNDNSLTESTIQILNRDDGKEVLSKTVKVGNNNLEFKLKEDRKYLIKIVLNYDLATNKLEQKKNCKGNKLFSYDYEYVFDYDLEISNIKTYRNQKETTLFQKNEDIILGFNSSNSSEAIPSKVTINGKEYELSVNGNRYEVQLRGFKDSGEKELKITSVTLDNNKKIKVSELVKIEILKDSVSLSDYFEYYSIESSDVTLKFNIVDKDKAFVSGKAILINSNDNTKQEQSITSGENSIVFTIKEDVSYKLKIDVTYTRDNGKQNIVNETIKSGDIKLVHGYELNVTDLETYNLDKQTVYFSKNEDIKIGFNSTNNTSFNPIKVVINGKEYDLEKTQNQYKATINGYSKSGVFDISLEKIILQNGKQLPTNLSTKIEVLKEIPRVDTFSYTESKESNQIEASFTLHDEENVLKNGTITVLDSKEIPVYTSDTITNGVNTINFNKTTSEFYNVVVKADYDLDTNELDNDKNEYKSHILLFEEIEVKHDAKIEMKDIYDVTLYKQDGDDVTAVSTVNVSELSDLSNYLVKVDMKKLPSLYAPIKSYSTDGGILKFILDCDKYVQYDEAGEKYHHLEVTYGAITDNVAQRDTLETFINKIKDNPSGTYKLTHDMDFSSINSGVSAIDVEFTGTLDGNGYTISNLSRPLFTSLNGAKLENLVIQDASVKAYGVIAPIMSNATVRNVHLKNAVVTAPGANGTGSFAGIANSKTVIENSSATNVTVGSAKRTGGLIGKMNNTTVRNCYISGKVSSNSDGSGGLIGEALSGSIIENCYVNVKTNFSNTSGSVGGVIGNPENALLNNTLSVATSSSGDGRGARMFGRYLRDVHNYSTNNYELATSNLNSNASHKAVSEVAESTLRTKEFYTNTLGFSENIWDFTNVESGRYPTLKGTDPNYVGNQVNKPKSDKVYIPDYERISNLSAYDTEKEILYNNLYELMPFYDAKYIVLQGAKIPASDILNHKFIKSILPYDEDGKMIVTLTDNNPGILKKIKVIFEDNSIKEYTVIHEITENNIATYIIQELEVYYNYNKYLIKEDASIINDLIVYVNGLDYTNDLDVLTSEADSRLYKDYYNEQTKMNTQEFILELLQNNTSNNVTIENSILNNIIKNEYIETGNLKQILYAYNYYKRWYTINIGGADIANLMMFHGDMFSKNMTIEALTRDVLASSNRATNRTDSFYANSLARYTGYNNITNFLDSIIVTLGGYSDVNDWFTENWQGAILEVPLPNYPEINYRAWPHLKAWPANLLPFLTLPKNAGFIVSGPSNYIIGGQRVYITYPDNPAEHEILVKKMQNFGNLMKEYYNTIAGTIDAKYFNTYHDVHYDTTKWKKVDGSYVYIRDYTSQADEPYMKNFNEAMGIWHTALSGVNAYAYGNRVHYQVAEALNAFGTWSHEGAHNQDAKIFLKGLRRRVNGQGEDYSDGNISQYHGDGSINFNLAYNYTMSDAITTNLTTERINTSEKLYDYYRKMFETLYLLDYVEAQAFLRLTPEEQAKVSVRVSYPNVTSENDTRAEARDTTNYTPSTIEDIKKMNLKTMADLWDNRITIRPGVTASTSVGRNKYGGASLYNRNWYQPHNDYGRPDSYSFKYLAWEMMGYAGYDNGYIKYFSNQTTNDLAALRAVTGDANITWRQYKLQRFQEIADVSNNLGYIDTEELIKEYEKALKTDAKNNDRNIPTSTNLRRIYYHYLKRVTNDFRDEVLKSKTELEANKKIIHISTAQQLQEKITEKPYGYYVLDNDIDVSKLTGTNAIVDTTFFGRLDGNGHTIIGNKLPLFNKLNYSVISNLTLNSFDVNYVGGYIGLANNITGTTYINNVTSSERKIDISSLEDFLKIGVDVEYPLGKSYNITADIDFSQIKNTDIKTCSADYKNGSCIVAGIFTGKIYGNGHTFSNLTNATLFNDFRGSVSDLNITDFTNNRANQNYVSAFARVSNNATLSNMKFKNITLSGSNGVAPVVAMDGRTGNSSFEKISVENANVRGSGVYTSAFIGRKFGGSVTNCLVQGTVRFGGTANGGVFGATEGNEIISNVIANVTIERIKNTSGYDSNGGMFGQIVRNPKLVENSISLGNIAHVDGSAANISKFLSYTNIIPKLSNCYEYERATGVSYATDATKGKLDVATDENVHSIEFYRDILKLNSTIWDFSSVKTDGYPTLK